MVDNQTTNSPRAAEADELRSGQSDAAFAPDADPSVSGSAREAPSDSGIGGRGESQTTVKVSGEATWRAEQEQRVIQLAVAAERERCAKIADRHANCAAIKSKFDDGYTSAAKDIADEIRSA